MMYLEIAVIGILSAIFGSVIMFFLAKHTKILYFLSSNYSKKHTIINNPDLLAEKLNAGNYVDDGEKLSFSVVDSEGKKKLVLNRTKQEEVEIKL